MAESEDLMKKVEAKKNEFQGLFERMDKSTDLYLMKPYTLKDSKGNDLPNVVSTTLNDPATFAHRSIAILSSADPQVVVESDTMNMTQENDVEQFIPALEYEADAMLSRRIRGMTFPFFCESSCVRGWLTGMELIRMEKGRLIPDRRPLDPRHVIYDTGINGLEWACYWSSRSGLKIKQQYGVDVPEDKPQIVYDIYSRTHNQVWLGDAKTFGLGTKIRDQVHPFRWNGDGYVPFVIVPIPSGSMLEHEDMIVHQGEDIFALDRQLYPKMNEMASVLENLTMASFFAAKQYASEAGEAAEAPELSPFGLGVVVSVEKQGGFNLIPMADIRNATRLLYSIYENRIQRGSLPNIDYGNLTFPLSAVAISRLTESKDMIFVPRLQGLAMFYQQWDKMAIRQYLQIGKDLELGEEGTRKVFKSAGLKGDYTIKRKYYSISPDQDIANTAVGMQHMQLGISRDTIFRNTLKLKDPDGEIMKGRSERAEQLNPVIMLRRLAISLVNREEFFEAELVLQQAEDLLRQRAMGQAVAQTTQGETKQSPQGGSLIPLLGEGGGASRGKTDEERVEEEMSEEERLGRLAETARTGRPTPE